MDNWGTEYLVPLFNLLLKIIRLQKGRLDVPGPNIDP